MNKKSLSSSVFKKVIMGVTGLALVGFVVVHLLGNLLLYKSDASLFNLYALKLHNLGVLLYVAEVGLAFFFLYHAFTGIRLAFSARSATPMKYQSAQSKGGSSKWGLASNNMVISGTTLLVFLVLHIWHFKFGPGIEQGYVATLEGAEARDLHRHVYEQFKNPLIVFAYVAVMATLGLHLRHGIWSAFHSLGLTRENNSKLIYLVGGGLGILLGAGFLMIPVYIYFFGSV